MPKKRAKKNNSDRVLGSDRISLLPDPILYHILSFVPTLNVVRMSLLSRRWRRVWYSVPSLRFSDVGYRRRPQVFEAFVEACLMHRERAMRYVADAEVTSLQLYFHFDYHKPNGLKEWLSSPIIQNFVQELDVCGKEELHIFQCYGPQVAVSGRSLVTVNLSGLRWDTSCSVYLPSLKSLCLARVSIPSETLYNLVTGCPLLVKFVFKGSGEFRDLRISSSSLEFVQVQGVKSVKVEAVNLQSLVVSAYGVGCDFSACREIKDLSIKGATEETLNLTDLISNLTRLENLSLSIYRGHEHIKISSQNLKMLSVTSCSDQELNIRIETPNLVSFHYEGTAAFSISMEAPSHKLNGSFLIRRPYLLYKREFDRDWFKLLKTFLSNINFPWNSISLHVHDNKDLIIPKAMRTRFPPLPNLKHLKVVSNLELMRKCELRKSLQWISPSLETLSIEEVHLCKKKSVKLRRSTRRILRPLQEH